VLLQHITQCEIRRRPNIPVRLVSYEDIVHALRRWALFDGEEGRDLASELPEYYIADFTNWKDRNSYKTEFAKFVRGLSSNR
jgi:hypothetical protein